MLCFVIMTNILLLTSLIAILSQVYTKASPTAPMYSLRHELKAVRAVL